MEQRYSKSCWLFYSPNSNIFPKADVISLNVTLRKWVRHTSSLRISGDLVDESKRELKTKKMVKWPVLVEKSISILLFMST
jgi:hypothetical protein